MKRRVQLELNAPRVNWPILQSQPLECVLSDGTDPLSLPFPIFLPLCHATLVQPLFPPDTRGHACRRSPTLGVAEFDVCVLLHRSIFSSVYSFSHFVTSLCCTSFSCRPHPSFAHTHAFVRCFFHSLLPPLPPSLTSSLSFLPPYHSPSPSLIPVE